tara:strand:+ start:280 stop:489 length:210 start_codon:yes stop_codon:yes gene_type:complete
MTSTGELKDTLIRRGSVDNNEIDWSGNLWNEPNIDKALYELFNQGLVDSSLIGCKLTAKGSQARNWAQS